MIGDRIVPIRETMLERETQKALCETLRNKKGMGCFTEALDPFAERHKNKIMIKHIFLLLLCGIVTQLTAQKDLYQKKWYTNSRGDSLPYRMLLPENYDKNQDYPLVVFLHGAGERGNDNEAQLQWGSEVFTNETNRKKFPAIVIFPQCAKEDYWAKVKYRKKRKIGRRFKFPTNLGKPNKSFRLAEQLIRKMIREEAVDVKRIYIAGLSMGGMGTFEMLARFPKKYAAAIAICGGGNLNHTIHYAKHTSVWIFHGSGDPVVGVRHSRRIAKQLKKFKADVRYTEYEGVDHLSWIPAFKESDFLEWLFSKEL